MLKIPNSNSRLGRDFYAAPTADVAREILGCAIVRRVRGSWTGGLIVESEAYLSGDDLASHAARGQTPGNASMFERAGTIYVYPIHAKHCLNVVTEQSGRGSAVLIRAIEPVWGIDGMRERRGQTDLRKLTRGPGMICQAMAVDRSQDGRDMIDDAGWRLASTPVRDAGQLCVSNSSRIGISRDVDLPLRFFINGNRYVSGRAGDHSRQPKGSLLNREVVSIRNEATGHWVTT